MSESLPAVPGSLPLARRAVTRLAEQAGAVPEQIDSIRLAASEALTNVILHAYPDRHGEIHLAAAVIENELWVLVTDDGDGLRSPSERSGLGLGLSLIAQAADELTIINRWCGGTELRMRFRVGGEDVGAFDQCRGSVFSGFVGSDPALDLVTHPEPHPMPRTRFPPGDGDRRQRSSSVRRRWRRMVSHP